MAEQSQRLSVTARTKAFQLAKLGASWVGVYLTLLGAQQAYFVSRSTYIQARVNRVKDARCKQNFSSDVNLHMLEAGYSRDTAVVKTYHKWKQTGLWKEHFESRA